jgi:phi13 family phage major tail protein
MAVQTGEKKSVVGIDQLYYALVTQDDDSDYVVGSPVAIAPAADLSLSESINEVKQFADDALFGLYQTEAETKFDINVTALPAEVQAAIFGHVLDAESGELYDLADGQAPDCAFGFRAQKSNGSYKYYWFLKGKFGKGGQEFATKGDQVDPKNSKLTFTAVRTIYKFTLDDSGTAKAAKNSVIDEDTTNASSTDWFTAVQEPTYTAP